MQNRISIYLSGSVVKGPKENEENVMLWGDIEMSKIQEMFSPVEVDFLNPSERGDDLANSATIVGRDLMQVYFCDVVLMDAREKRGLGVGAEMAFAVMQNIPVISVAPTGTHYHKTDFQLLYQHIDNWTHPFVEGMSNQVVETVEEAVASIKEKFLVRKTPVADRNNPFFRNIKLYLDTQLSQDTPMQELFAANDKLQQRKEEFLKMMNSPGYEPKMWKDTPASQEVAAPTVTSSSSFTPT